MFPSHIYSNPLLSPIRDFVSGNMDISEFIDLYNQDDAMGKFLDYIIDYIETNKLPIENGQGFTLSISGGSLYLYTHSPLPPYLDTTRLVVLRAIRTISSSAISPARRAS